VEADLESSLFSKAEFIPMVNSSREDSPREILRNRGIRGSSMYIYINLIRRLLHLLVTSFSEKGSLVLVSKENLFNCLATSSSSCLGNLYLKVWRGKASSKRDLESSAEGYLVENMA